MAIAVAWGLVVTAPPMAQSRNSVAIRTAETSGIRRNNYPVSAVCASARHAGGCGAAQVLSNGAEVPAIRRRGVLRRRLHDGSPRISMSVLAPAKQATICWIRRGRQIRRQPVA